MLLNKLYKTSLGRLTSLGAIITMSVLAVGCSGNSPERINAQMLFDGAKNALDADNPDLSLSLLDSLDATCPGEVEILRQSMDLRPRAIARQSEKMLLVNDSLLRCDSIMMDSISPMIMTVTLPNVDIFYVAKDGYDPTFTNKTGISARMTSYSQFYIVSSVNPAGNLHHWSLTASVGDLLATTDTVPYDGVLNYRLNNSELISFSPDGSLAVGQFIYDNRDQPITLTFNGQNGSKKNLALTPQQVEAIATIFEASRLQNHARTLSIERERLIQRMKLAQSQIDKLQSKQ